MKDETWTVTFKTIQEFNSDGRDDDYKSMIYMDSYQDIHICFDENGIYETDKNPVEAKPEERNYILKWRKEHG